MRNIIFFSIIFLLNKSWCQAPISDPNYYLDFSDFTENSGQNSLSGVWNSTPGNTWGLETYSPSNAYVQNGILTLKCEKIGNSYISGGISTVNNNGIENVNKKTIKYGYVEIQSKTPTQGIQGPWGGFWVHTGEGGWDEIDCFEPNGCDTRDANKFHNGAIATTNGVTNGSPSYITENVPNMSLNFNKYAFKWTPQYVEIFVNDISVRKITNKIYIPTHGMFLFLTHQVDDAGCQPIQANPYPTAYWQFKNLKYYKLKTNCSIGVYADNFNFLTHNYKVHQYYSLGSSTIPSNSNIYFHATNYVELRPNFTVPLGSTLNITTHFNTCPN